MIELCRTEGQKLLFEGQYDRVVPAALESLKFSIEVYGLSSIELVPSYLILGEASIGWYFQKKTLSTSLKIDQSATVYLISELKIMTLNLSVGQLVS